MSSTLSNAIFRVGLSCDITNAGLEGEVTHSPADQRPLIGTATGRANVVFNDYLTLPAGTAYDLDFTHLYDPAGNFNTWAHILDLMVENSGGSNITLGGGTSGLFTAIPIPIRPSAFMVPIADLLQGMSVGGTNRVLRLTSSPGSSIARVSALGRTT
jgi:hypothetical protein